VLRAWVRGYAAPDAGLGKLPPRRSDWLITTSLAASDRSIVMTTLMAVPLGDGDDDVVLFEVDPSEVPGELVLAADEPGKAIARASETLDDALTRLRPTLKRIVDTLHGLAPQETEVEFGLKIGGEYGFIIAKGTAEVNFVIRMHWSAEQPMAEKP
jgi:hypothetical protein